MFRATLVGFVDPDQAALVEPYRPEYFAAVGDVWREWSLGDGAGLRASRLHVVRRGHRDGRGHRRVPGRRPEPPAALRRLLSEGRDEVLRSLRNQARDRAEA